MAETIQPPIAEKPDWIVSSLMGKLRDPYSEGVGSEDFDIQPADVYWGKQSVQKYFNNDRPTFDGFYNYQADRYNKSRSAQLAVKNFVNQPVTALNRDTGVSAPRTIAYDGGADPLGRSYLFGAYGDPKYSMKQNAISRGVRTAPGKYTPLDQFSGDRRVAKNQDGSYKLDEDGRPHFEPLKKGERMRSFDEDYSPTWDFAGNYGYNYNFGNSMFSLLKNPINAFLDWTDSLLNYPKSAYGAMTNKDLTSVTALQNRLKASKIPSPEVAQGDFWHPGNINDMAQQVVWQLASMYGVGATTRALGGSAKTSAVAGRLFMTGITAGPIAELAQDQGLSPRETSMLLAASTPAMYAVSFLSDKVIKGGLDPMMFRQSFKDVLQNSYKVTFGSGKPDAAKMRTFISNISSGLGKIAYQTSKSAPVVGTAAMEGVEEVLEQGVDLGSRLLYNFYNNQTSEASPTARFLGTTKGNLFNINAANEWDFMAQSFVGGAIGGSIAHGILAKLRKSSPQLASDLEQMIADGREKDVRAFIDNAEKNGSIDIAWVREDGSKAAPDDRNTINSRNANILRGVVDYLSTVYRESGLDQVKANNDVKAETLRGALAHSSVADDAMNLLHKIKDMEGQLTDTKAALSPEDTKIISEQLEATKQLYGAIRNGEFVKDYVAQGLYNLQMPSAEGQTPSLTGKNFVSLNKAIVASHEELGKQVVEQNKILSERDKAATIDDYAGVTEAGKSRLVTEIEQQRQQAAQSIVAAADQIKAVDPAFDIEAFASTDVEDAYEEAQMLEGSLQNLDAALKPVVESAIALTKKAHALSHYKGQQTAEELMLAHQLVNMVDVVLSKDRFGKDVRTPVHSITPIVKRINDERAEEAASIKNDVSTYTATSRLNGLLDAINIRRAQVAGNRILSSNKSLEDPGYPLVHLSDDEAKAVLITLHQYEDEIQRLIAVSKENEANSEARIRAALMQRYETRLSTIEDVASRLAQQGQGGVSDIINSYHEKIYSATQSQDFQAINSALRQMEQLIYSTFRGNKDVILNALNTSDKFNEESLETDQAQSLSRAYDYMRGVLSYPANDIWNALLATVQASTDNVGSTSEQDLVVVEAVRNMLAGRYDYPFAISASGDVRLHNSTIVDGAAGTGKTSVVIPLIAGVMQRVTGGKIALSNYAAKRSAFTGMQVKELGSNLIDALSADSDVSLVVYDEATLLSREDLRSVQSKLDSLNRTRKSPLYILYTADTYQNNAPDPSAPGRALSVSNKRTIVVPRTDRLTFSFRSQNMPLKLAEEHFRLSQDFKHDPGVFEYSSTEGMQFVQSREQLQKEAMKLIEHLRAHNQLNDAVYITNQPDLSPVEGIVASGIKVLSSRSAQGQEWDYVIGDDKDGNPYASENATKAYYTTVTRARKKAIVFASQESGLKSTKGTVTQVTPLSPDATSRENKMQYLRAILGNDFKQELSQLVTVAPKEDALFKDDPEAVINPPKAVQQSKENKNVAPPPVTVPTVANQTVASKVEPDKPQTGDLDIDFPDANYDSESAYPGTAAYDHDHLLESDLPVEEEVKTLVGPAIKAMMNPKERSTVFTFFTPGQSSEEVDENITVKKSVLYDAAARANMDFQVTINRIGSPGYENAFRNNPDLKGNFALFLEVVQNGKPHILGVLSSADYSQDQLKAIAGANEHVSISIDKSVIDSAVRKSPYIVNTQGGQDLTTLKPLQRVYQEAAPGISFSSPMIVMQKAENSPGKQVGDVVVFSSFRYSRTQMDEMLRGSDRVTGKSDEFMTAVSMRGRRDLTLKEVSGLMEPHFTRNTQGLFRMDDNAWALYDTLWAHNTRKNYTDDGTELPSHLENSIALISKNANDDTYRKFLGDLSPRYALSNYIERSLLYRRSTTVNPKLAQEIAHYERFFSDLRTTPGFTEGLRFDPRHAPKSSTSVNYAFASKEAGLGEMYDTMLQSSIGYVESPRILVDKNAISSEIARNTPSKPSPSVINPTVTTVIDNPADGAESPEGVEEDNVTRIKHATPHQSFGDFAEAEFAGPKAGLLMQAISAFRHRVFDNMYILTGRPRMHDLNTAMQNTYASLIASGNDHPVDGPLARNFDFLLSRYFPAIIYNDDAGTYQYKADYVKARGFFDKDSFSLLDEGMTAMVKTYLYGTPVVETDSEGRLVESGRYISEGEIPELVEAVRGTNDLTQAGKLLSTSTSDGVRSFYLRFLAPSPATIAGRSTYSLSHFVHSASPIQAAEAFNIVNTVLSFLKSGAIYHSAVTDTTSGTSIPNSLFQPNIAKEIGLRSINLKVNSVGVKRISSKEVIIGSQRYSTNDSYTPEQAITAMKQIGIQNFGMKHLEYLSRKKVFGADKLGNFSADRALAANGLVHQVAVRVGVEASGGKEITLNGPLDAVFGAIASVDGIRNMLSSIVEGKRKYRLRNGAPFFNTQVTIDNIRQQPNTVLKDNLVIKGDYSLLNSAAYIHEGVRRQTDDDYKFKGSDMMRAQEIIETDVLYRFADMVDKHDLASFPVITYSDSTTEPAYVVSSARGWFRSPEAIAGELFDARSSWFESMAPLVAMRQVPVKIDAGMFTADRSKYSPENREAFIKQVAENYNQFENIVRTLSDARGITVWQKLQQSKRDPAKYLKAFFYNQLAFASSLREVTTGSPYQFKGRNESAKYVDMVKRAKMMVSTRSAYVFRDENWDARVREFRTKHPGAKLPQDLMLEGMKLSPNARVAFVTDLSIPVNNLSNGSVKNQDVYDGATFVTPLTRAFQRMSSGGNYGVFVGPVMKNITTGFNAVTGISTFVKNAEFEITPDMLRNAGPMAIQFLRNSLNVPFKTTPGTPLEVLHGLGVAEDFSNITREHFEKLATQLVEMGEQDTPILEIIPMTSAKTGAPGVNIFDAPQYIPSTIDWTNKGSQLDAMKETDEPGETKMVNQLVNAVSVGWTDPQSLSWLYNALAHIADTFNTRIADMKPEEFDRALRQNVRDSISSRDSVSYRSRAARTKDFSLQDRQVIGSLVPTLMSRFNQEAIAFKMSGGQYVLTPSYGMVTVYDVIDNGEKKTVLKSQLNGRTPVDPVGRSIHMVEPVRKSDGKTLSQVWAESPGSVTNSLDAEEWTGGYCEVIMPATMRDEFMLTEALQANTAIQDIDSAYFLKQLQAIQKDNPRAKNRATKHQADLMFASFRERLDGIGIRVPSTAMHSAMPTRIVGFIEDSMNVMLVPPQFHAIQGTDMDIDMGNYLTFQSFNGVTPFATDDFQLSDKDAELVKGFPKEKERVRRMAIENRIVSTIRDLVQNSRNANNALTPVDDVLSDWRKFRDQSLSASKFEMDSYLSHVRIHELNQAGGRALVGIMATSNKGWLLLNIYNNLNPESAIPGIAQGLTWRSFAGLINMMTDNAKEGIAGPIGINNETASFAAYLTAYGWNQQQIYEFLKENRPYFDKMATYSYVSSDAEYGFQPDEDQLWKQNPALIDLYYRVQEYKTLSTSALNRSLPSRSAFDAFQFRNNIESFIKRSFKKASNSTVAFDFIRFTLDKEYAEVWKQKYDTLLNGENQGLPSGRHGINILKVLQGNPHIASYLRTYARAAQKLQQYPIIKQTDEIAKAVKLRVTQGTYNDIQDFVYGLAVDQYFKKRDFSSFTGRTPANYLRTPADRQNFVQVIHDQFESLQKMYPDNTLIQQLVLATDERMGVKTHRLRLPDLMNLSEETTWELSQAMQQLPDKTRTVLFLYNLVTTRDSAGRGSLAPLFMPTDNIKGKQLASEKWKFTRFLEEEFQADTRDLRDVYTHYYKKQRDGYNYIPFSSMTSAEGPVRMTTPLPAPPVVPAQPAPVNRENGGIRIPSTYRTLVNDLIRKNFPKSAAMNVTSPDELAFNSIIQYGDHEVNVKDVISEAAKKRVKGMTQNEWIQASKLMREYEKMRGETSQDEVKEQSSHCRIVLK